jgi:hypothetical protein
MLSVGVTRLFYFFKKSRDWRSTDLASAAGVQVAGRSLLQVADAVFALALGKRQQENAGCSRGSVFATAALRSFVPDSR